MNETLQDMQNEVHSLCTTPEELLRSDVTRRVLEIFFSTQEFNYKEQIIFYQAIRDRLEGKDLYPAQEEVVFDVIKKYGSDILSFVSKLYFKRHLNDDSTDSILVEQRSEYNEHEYAYDTYTELSLNRIIRFLLPKYAAEEVKNAENIEELVESLKAPERNLTEDDQLVIEQISGILLIEEERIVKHQFPDYLHEHEIEKLTNLLKWYATRVNRETRYGPEYREMNPVIASFARLLYIARQQSAKPEQLDMFAKYYYPSSDTLEQKIMLASMPSISVDISENLIYAATQLTDPEEQEKVINALLSNKNVRSHVKDKICVQSHRKVNGLALTAELMEIKLTYGVHLSDRDLYILTKNKNLEDAKTVAENIVLNVLQGNSYCSRTDDKNQLPYSNEVTALYLIMEHNLLQAYKTVLLEKYLWSHMHDGYIEMRYPSAFCTPEELKLYEDLYEGSDTKTLSLQQIGEKFNIYIDSKRIEKLFLQFSNHGHTEHHKGEYVWKIAKQLDLDPSDEFKHSFLNMIVSDVYRHKRRRETPEYSELRRITDYLTEHANLFTDEEKIASLRKAREWKLERADYRIETLRIQDRIEHMEQLAEEKFTDLVDRMSYNHVYVDIERGLNGIAQLLSLYSISKERKLVLLFSNLYREDDNDDLCTTISHYYSSPRDEEIRFSEHQWTMSNPLLKKLLEQLDIRREDYYEYVVFYTRQEAQEKLETFKGSADNFDLWNEPRLQELVAQYKIREEVQGYKNTNTKPEENASE